MNIYLPEPYPDELFYSVVARYVAYSGVKKIYKLYFDLSGHYVLNPFLPQGLLTASKRTWAEWHMTGEKIALLLTMYPFYQVFIPSSIKEQVFTSLLGTTKSFFISLPRLLRYCPTCRRNDIAKYSETYWKRIHQMKGVAVCPDHGEVLVPTRLPYYLANEDLVQLTEATLCGQTAVPNLNQLEKEQLLTIARRCRKFLNDEVEPKWENAGPRLYQKVAMEKGLCTDPNECERQIVQKFREMYSDKVIKTFEVGEHKRADDWIKEIFFSPNVIFRPVAHAAAQEFLSTLPNDSTNAILFGPGPWKCPNPFGQHNSPYPIKRVTIARDKHRKFFAVSTCCCGFGFAFYTTDPSDISMPLVHRVIHYGPTWEDEIQRLNSAGIDASKIAFLLKIPIEIVVSALAGLSLSNIAQIKLRRQWDKIINSTKSHNVYEAEHLNSKLYQKIKTSDPNYLLCYPSGTRRFGARYYGFIAIVKKTS